MKQFYRKVLDRLFWQYRGFAWRIALYIPSTQGANPIDNTPYVKQALEQFSNLFGGASANPVQGSWLGESGLVTENTVIVYSYASQFSESTRQTVLGIADQLKHTLNQESVALEITKVTGGLYLL